MKIGIDIDEVIVEFVRGYLKILAEKYNKRHNFEEITTYNFWECLPITKEETFLAMEDFFESEHFKNIAFIEGAKEIIIELSKNNEITFITSRPPKLKEKTENFIKNHFMGNNFKIIYSAGHYPSANKTKAEICEENGITVLIEDNPDYAKEAAEKSIIVFLLDKPWNKKVGDNDKIKRVKLWKEILKNIEQTRLENSKILIEKIKNFVKEECKKPTSHYGFEPYTFHFIPMQDYAKQLAEEFGADGEVVELAAWLHDIGSIICGREDHHITGAEIAEKKLLELGYQKEKIEKVKKCIFNHRGSTNLARESIEEQIVADADSMSHFDNLGGIFKAALDFENHTQISANKAVKNKLINSYNKLSPKAKEIIKPKYDAAMVLL